MWFLSEFFFLALGETLNLKLSFLPVEGKNIVHTMKAHEKVLSKIDCQLVVSPGL